jgi:putative ABC transport system permease protein
MIANYLKIAIRNIIRARLFSLINIIGLAIGMAGSLMIMTYVAGELNFESFHKNKDRIYRVATDFGQESSKMPFASTIPALGPALVEHVPEVENAVRFEWDSGSRIEYGDKSFRERNFFFVDESVFDVFSFELIRGSKSEALAAPYSVVISEAVAVKYFGDADPIGKSIIYNDEHPLKITGLIKNIPPNTHLKCDFLVSWSTLGALGREYEQPWNQVMSTYTYLLLKKNADQSRLLNKMKMLVQENAGEFMANILTFKLQPLSKIHMNADAIVDYGPKGNMTYVYVFGSVAILLLLIACFNFINLSTARYRKRMKEVGTRKVLGATRMQLVRQFLAESVCTTLIAVIISLLIFELCYPHLNSFLKTGTEISRYNIRYLYVFLPMIVIAVGFLAGSYPAFFLSRYKPVDTFRDKSSPTGGQSILRKIMVIAQFTAAVILIIITVAIYKQIHFMKNTDLGFNKENVVLLNCPRGGPDDDGNYAVLKEQFLQHPGVLSVSATYTVPGIGSKETRSFERVDADISGQITTIAVDQGFLETLGVELLDGRDFSRDISADIGSAVIINEQAVKALEFEDPIGRNLMLSMNTGLEEVTIIGVIGDFHITSLRERIEPLILYVNPGYYNLIAVRLDQNNSAAAFAHLERTWQSVVPDLPFDFGYLDNSYDGMYAREGKIGMFLVISSLLAIFVTLLGLFGLAAFMSEQRQKEISIRRVFGASIPEVFVLLVRQYTIWMLTAMVIAWPLAFYAGNRWLEGFAYRTNLSWYIFILAGAFAMLVAILTIGLQITKTLISNPADTLRHE